MRCARIGYAVARPFQRPKALALSPGRGRRRNRRKHVSLNIVSNYATITNRHHNQQKELLSSATATQHRRLLHRHHQQAVSRTVPKTITNSATDIANTTNTTREKTPSNRAPCRKQAALTSFILLSFFSSPLHSFLPSFPSFLLSPVPSFLPPSSFLSFLPS